MPRLLFACSLLLGLHLAIFSQNPSEPKRSADDEKLRDKAVELLRETSQDVNRMRSVENRISFSAELASLMWFYSEKDARAMYLSTITDFKQLLAELDEQYIQFDPTIPSDDEMGLGLFGPASRSPVERKLRIAMAVRQQIALSLAEHEPDLAYSFFYDTGAIITNEKFRADNERSDHYFEMQLMKQVAESNAAAAAKYGAKSIKDGIDGNHVDLLKKIYDKDADKGIEFGQALLSRLKGDKSAVKGLYTYSSLLSYGAENLEASKKPNAKKPVFSLGDLQDIADRFALAVLDSDEDDLRYGAGTYADQIAKFAPGRAAQIKAKMRTNSRSGAASNANMAVARAMSTAANAANKAADSSTEAARQEAEAKQFAKDLQGINKELPKEERDKVIAKLRKTIASTSGRDKKITALSFLAAQVAAAGDRDLADEIMRDAERLINPAPKNYRDFLYTWMVASGYAEADPDKAFPMLEATILRANETVAALVKVGEFIDVNEELIDDGEVQVGMFGGQMVRSLTQQLGVANHTLMSLARADFAKTRALTNTFDRIELRVLAKMLVLRAVLDDKTKEILDKNKKLADGEDKDDNDP